MERIGREVAGIKKKSRERKQNVSLFFEKKIRYHICARVHIHLKRCFTRKAM